VLVSKNVNKVDETSENVNALAVTVVKVVALEEVPDIISQVGVMLITEEGLTM
jgi:hypothetical protein